MLKKGQFTGSDNRMCFILEKRSEEEMIRLAVVVWPESYCYDATPGEKKTTELFKFSEDGLKQTVVWMNGQSKLGINQKIY